MLYTAFFGKYEEVEITLKWKQQGENFGGKVNIASISNISNPKGFKETKQKTISLKLQYY